MSNVRAILISTAALAAMALPGAAAPPAESQYIAYVGTYTRPNRSKGIYAYKFDAKTGKFTSIGVAAETPNPSFVVVHPNGKFVFAANEGNPPTVSAFAVEAGTGMLKPLNSVNSKGSGPCHLAIDRTGKWLFVANYNSGSAASFPIAADGSLGEAVSVVQHAGSSANPQRQRGPHAHEVVVSSDNKFVFVPDLGLDKVMIYKFDPAKGSLTANEPDSAKIAPGSGPRHLAFAPNGKFVYLMTEMTSSVVAFSYDVKQGSFKEMQTYPAVPADFTGQKSGAEIAVHPNGKFLYASNRNHNSITEFTIDAKGALALAGNVPSQGKTPRHFAIDPTGAFLIVENQDTDNVVVFKIDQKTGALTPTGDVLEVSQPVAVAFLPVK
jgi:6-phosphogluconolactonase